MLTDLLYLSLKKQFLDIFPCFSNCTKNQMILVKTNREIAPRIERLSVKSGGLESLALSLSTNNTITITITIYGETVHRLITVAVS